MGLPAMTFVMRRTFVDPCQRDRTASCSATKCKGHRQLQLAVTALLGSGVPTVGPSGGLFGLLIGFAMVFPHRKIVPLLPPIPMPAWLFVTL